MRQSQAAKYGMRKFITIIENNNLSPMRTKVGDITPAADTASTLIRNHQDMANSDLMRNVADSVPSILQDLQNLAVHDDSATLPATAAQVKYQDYMAGIDEGIPNTPENLPAVVSKGLADEDFSPQWHMIENLPGMMLQGIRMVGRMIFGQFTDLPVEKIQMMSTAMGLNPEVDVRKMFSLIKKYGVREDVLSYDFEQMPAYKAIAGQTDAQVWRAFGYEFMFMKDNGGHYVYAWPETPRKISGNVMEESADQPATDFKLSRSHGFYDLEPLTQAARDYVATLDRKREAISDKGHVILDSFFANAGDYCRHNILPKGFSLLWGDIVYSGQEGIDELWEFCA